ncbi:MAG: hypothetical protein VB064_11740 [Oscillospiraceae bacterium]|nr:hypothetical protein [Oscillospiraceae bacterium]
MDRDVILKSFKTILTTIFVILSAAYWVLFYLWEFRNLNIPYSIGELVGLGEFVIPIIAVIAILLQIKTIRRKEDTKRNTVILIVLVIVLLCSIGNTYYTAHGLNTGGLASIADKDENDGNYFLILNNELNGNTNSIKLECDKKTFDGVIIDEKVQYGVEYIWNTLTPQTGYLVSIDLDDYCDNRNNWMGNYFANRTSNKLTKAQLNIIKGSAAVISAVAEDAGVEITLDSVTGDGFYSYYKLDVELPEGVNAGDGYNFGKQRLLINDESIGLGTNGTSFMTLEDEDPADNCYSMLLSIRLTNYPANRNYSFNNGIVRTLHLENIITEENGKIVNLIEGQWDFGILFTEESKAVELINEPLIVSGYDFWSHEWYESKVSSFVLSGFSGYCEYEVTPNSVSSIIGISPIVVMKDGSKYQMMASRGSNSMFNYDLAVPISLDEVDYVQLSDDVILQVN